MMHRVSRFNAKALLLAFVLSQCLWLSGCDKLLNRSKTPQVQDLNSVGCLIANDFYAVHFSAYLKPTQSIQELNEAEREALLQPFCQEVPKPGKLFFTADLIDRDVRQTPVGIQIVSLEKTGEDDKKFSSFKQTALLSEKAPQLYPRGVVEAQADLSKEGYYAMILVIGGEDAIAEDDKLKIIFYVGSKPFQFTKEILQIGGAGLVGMLLIIFAAFKILKKRKLQIGAHE